MIAWKKERLEPISRTRSILAFVGLVSPYRHVEESAAKREAPAEINSRSAFYLDTFLAPRLARPRSPPSSLGRCCRRLSWYRDPNPGGDVLDAYIPAAALCRRTNDTRGRACLASPRTLSATHQLSSC